MSHVHVFSNHPSHPPPSPPPLPPPSEATSDAVRSEHHSQREWNSENVAKRPNKKVSTSRTHGTKRGEKTRRIQTQNEWTKKKLNLIRRKWRGLRCRHRRCLRRLNAKYSCMDAGIKINCIRCDVVAKEREEKGKNAQKHKRQVI